MTPYNQFALKIIISLLLMTPLAKANDQWKKYVPAVAKESIPDRAESKSLDEEADFFEDTTYDKTADSDSDVFYGPTNLNNSKFTNLQIFGTASLNNMTIEVLHVNGPLHAKNSMFGNLKCNGIVSLENTTVKKALINGPLKGKKVKIENLSISSSKVYFKDSQLQTIKIRKSQRYGSEPQKLILDNSTILGDIEFDDNQGKVYLKHNAKIMRHVRNGQLIEQ